MALFQSIFKTTHQGKASKCGVCGTQFKQNLMVLTNVVTHKCKRCNLYICINCGPENKKMKIHGYKDTKLHRVCTFCQNDKKYVNQYLIEPNLQSWIPNIPINMSLKQFYERDLQQNMPRFPLKNYPQKLSNYLNYSIKEYFDLQFAGLSVSMKEKILHGMKVYVIYKNHPKAQLNPEFHQIMEVLLAFCKQEYIAAHFLQKLIKDILPGQFYDYEPDQQQFKSATNNSISCGVQMLTHIINQQILNNQTCRNYVQIANQNEFNKIQQFLINNSAELFVNNLLINICPISNLFIIWDQVFRQSLIDPVIKISIFFIKISKNLIVQDKDLQTIQEKLLSISTDEIVKALQEFDRYIPNFNMMKQQYIQQQIQIQNQQRHMKQQQQIEHLVNDLSKSQNIQQNSQIQNNQQNKQPLQDNNSSELGLNSQFKNPSNRQTSQSVASDFYSQKEKNQQQINANNNEFCINKKQNLDGVIFDPSVVFENERFDEKYITTQVLNLDYQTKYNYFLQNQLDFKGYEIEFNQFINQLQPDPNLQKKYQQLAYGGY